MALRPEILIDDMFGGALVSGAFMEVDSGLPLSFPLLVVLWVSAAKLKRVLDKTILRDANQTPISLTWRVYQLDGVTVQQTYTDTYAYDAKGSLVSVTRIIT